MKTHNGFLCFDCLMREAEKVVTCPNCGTLMEGTEHEVSLLLTRPGASPKQKSQAQETLVLVCPACHILFLDNFHYQILQSSEK